MPYSLTIDNMSHVQCMHMYVYIFHMTFFLLYVLDTRDIMPCMELKVSRCITIHMTDNTMSAMR